MLHAERMLWCWVDRTLGFDRFASVGVQCRTTEDDWIDCLLHWPLVEENSLRSPPIGLQKMQTSICLILGFHDISSKIYRTWTRIHP